MTTTTESFCLAGNDVNPKNATDGNEICAVLRVRLL